MLRGLRTLSDMEYEFTMSLMNLNLDPEIETVFLMAKEEFSHVSQFALAADRDARRRPVEVPAAGRRHVVAGERSRPAAGRPVVTRSAS